MAHVVEHSDRSVRARGNARMVSTARSITTDHLSYTMKTGGPFALEIINYRDKIFISGEVKADRRRRR